MPEMVPAGKFVRFGVGVQYNHTVTTAATNLPDGAVLADFAANGSAAAFAEIVRRYVDLVHTTARRLVADPHQAEDVTQAAFIVLAKKAARLDAATLPGWLVVTTRLAAKHALRTDRNRQKHERQAAEMRPESNAEEPTADDLLPLLDEALGQLSDADRTAVVRRFLQGQSFAQVAAATGSTEEAARKRVGRAVEKLRTIFMKKGVAPSVGGLMVVLAAQQAQAAPAIAVTTAGTAASASIAKGVTGGLMLANLKVAVAIGGVLLLAGAAGVQVARHAVAQAPATRPAAPPAAPPPANQVGEVYVGGEVARPGVYSITGRSVNVKQILIAAGATEETIRTCFVSLIRRNGGQEQWMLRDQAIAGLFNGDAKEVVLQANDIVQVMKQPGIGAPNPAGEIGAGDLLEVSIADLIRPGAGDPLFFRVDEAGSVSVPLIGLVPVGGLTTDVAAVRIAEAYSRARIIDKGVTTVAIRERRAAATVRPGPVVVGETVTVMMHGLGGGNRLSLHKLTVAADGTVDVPEIGKVQVAGLSEHDATIAGRNALRDKRIENRLFLALLRGEAPSPLAAGMRYEKVDLPVKINAPDTPIAVGDVVEVAIDDLVAPNVRSIFPGRVNAEGLVRVELVGPVKVAGLKPAAAAEAVAGALKKARVMDSAAVWVNVVEPASKTSIKPGPFGVGDTVRVGMGSLVAPHAAIEAYAQVAADGTIQLPLVGPFKIEGLTEDAAADAISKRFSERKIVDKMPVLVIRTGTAK